MKKTSKSLLLFGALSLSSCGTLLPTPQTLQTEDTQLSRQGTAPICNNPAAGGSFPYTSSGPAQRQTFFLNDGASPINYHSFSTDLPDSSSFVLEPYPFSSTASTTATPIYYDHFYRPTLRTSGVVQNTNGQAGLTVGQSISEAYFSNTAITGLLYLNSAKQFHLRVQQAGNDFKQFDASGQVITDSAGNDKVFSGALLQDLTLGGKLVRFAGKQNLKVESYLAGHVTFKKEVVLVQYRDPSTGSVSTGKAWVTVDMPYQDLYVKVTTDRYVLYDTTGQRTVLTQGQPLLLKTSIRGFTTTPDADHRFYWRKELSYSLPQGITSGSSSLFQSWLDGRRDAVLGWTINDQKLGKVTVDASGNASLPTEVRSLSDLNLGAPSFSNDRNCISKTVSVEQNGNFSILQPLATGFQTVTFTEGQQGLKAEYFDNLDFTNKRFERLDGGIDFNWGGYSPAQGVVPETYSVRWSGQIRARGNDNHTFTFTGGSNVRIKLNERELVLTPGSNPQTVTAQAFLTRGVDYNLTVEYQHNTGPATARLEWQSASQALEVVPGSWLSPLTRLMPTRKTFSVASRYALALDRSGNVWAWGNNRYGIFGTSEQATTSFLYGSNTPLKAQNLSEIIEVDTSRHAVTPTNIALKADGTVWVWGDNSAGQLADGTKVNRFTPAQVAGLSNIVRVYIQDSAVLAIDRTGKVYQWGASVVWNGTVFTTPQLTTPAVVQGIDSVADVLYLGNAYLFLKRDGTVWAYGRYNFNHTFGDGSNSGSDHTTPVQVLAGATGMARTGSTVFAVKADGSLWTWGKDFDGTSRPYPTQVAGIADVVEVSAYAQVAIARTRDGKVYTWGTDINDRRTLGAGFLPYRYTPGQITGQISAPIVGIAAGAEVSTVIDEQGRAYGWGYNGNAVAGPSGTVVSTPTLQTMTEVMVP